MREWWIEPDQHKFCIHESLKDITCRSEVIHVIEKSAYDKIKEELAEARRDLDAHKSICAQYSELVVARADNHELRKELTEARAEIERLGREDDLLTTALEQARAECEKLTKERTTYRTLNSLMGDNGQICELHDEIDQLKLLTEQQAAELERLKAWFTERTVHVFRHEGELVAQLINDQNGKPAHVRAECAELEKLKLTTESYRAKLVKCDDRLRLMQERFKDDRETYFKDDIELDIEEARKALSAEERQGE